MHCQTTCHEDCQIPFDEDKRSCWVIDGTGHCTVCPQKCFWTIHKNNGYVYKVENEKVTVTIAEMKKDYEEALKKQLTDEEYIESMTESLEYMSNKIWEMLEESNKCKSKLKEIALRPDPLSTVEHIDLWIKSEELDKQSGYFERIHSLQEMRNMALVEVNAQAFGKDMKITISDIESVRGKTDEKKNFFAKLLRF